MPTVIMPKMGDGMEEGTLLRWLKNVGDQINVGDVLAEVETDKVTVEVESPVAGKILDLQAEPGQVIQVGSVIGHVGAAGEQTPVDQAPGSTQTVGVTEERRVAEKQVASPAKPSGNGAEKAVPPAPAPASPR